ncbi:MAG: amylo-alpha-1,6-glucosidase [Thermoanaerobaculia bacterium]
MADSSTLRVADVELHGWTRGESADALLTREWLVTNGLGGYATGTIAGIATRRYHGLLVAALPVPFGRTVMLNHLEERVAIGEVMLSLSGDEPAAGEVRLPDVTLLEEFKLELGLPVWRFANDDVRITKRLLMPHQQNTTFITYHLDAASKPVRLLLRPSLHFRPHEQDVTVPIERPYVCVVEGTRFTIAESEGAYPLRIDVRGGAAKIDGASRLIPELLYRIEKSRGYGHAAGLWTPGTIEVTLEPGATVTLIASTEDWDLIGGTSAEEAFGAECQRRERLLGRANVETAEPLLANLVLAADQFVITPETRRSDAARLRAGGDEPRTVIAGYHWFTDWGRDTMISLEGLTLATGRIREAGSILRTFASYVRDGLIPNMFPEGENEGVYHTADATLWFFHAVKRYVDASGDRQTLGALLPVLHDIIDHHLRGTRFGIGVDARDGLLRQGAEGYQLTWMDAKVDGWVVTPRRGKAVEINALFYNALMLLEEWSRDAGEPDRGDALRQAADRVRVSFNERFWFEDRRYLYDVVDGEDGTDDPALRPNQIFSISLDHPVLERSRWERVIEVVRDELLTPVGLRSLARSHPDYKRTYEGDLRSRDAAYHQGTVWSWLIGPYVDAVLRVRGDVGGARRALDGLVAHLRENCIGFVSEVFDAERPFTPGGCVAQAWGVAELLRCLLRTES